ncbi:MAG: hypothetical protein MJ175_06195 [Clostridia bacterium]|nr:hypothetical protein [Clostridia bacterium]
MPKKRKKRRIYTEEEQEAAKAGLKKSLKTFNFRLAILMAVIFLVLTVGYYYLIWRMVWWASPVLYTAAAVLFLAFFFVNRGFSREPVDRRVLNPEWSEEKKDAFIEDDIMRKAFARKLMIPLVPLLLLVGVDIIVVVLLPMLK